jgi:hypothetical protein
MFKKPETFEGLDLDALRALSAEAMDEARALLAADDADLTDEQIAQAESLMAASAEIDAEVATRETADAERAAKIAELRGKTAEPEEEPEAEEPEEDPEEDPENAEEPEGAEAETPKEVVVASTPAPKRTVAIAQKRAPEPPAPEAQKATALVAAGKSLATMSVNEEFPDLTAVALEFASTAKRGPAGDMTKFKVPQGSQWGLSSNHTRNTFAKFQRADRVHQIGQRMSADEQLRVINDAGKFAGDTTALVAAGGWCAPSETMYDFCSYETVSGILDIPTISVTRGGINFSKGPDYSTIAAAAASGFQQTEAQAEAGTAKVCLAVDCPPFEEIRLDAIGFCLTNGILTDTAYPELTRRYLEILAVAHAHAVNKYVIDAIIAEVGPAVEFGGTGASTADLLEAITFNAWKVRSMYAMGPNATIEGFLPTWAKPIIQADLSRRTGVDMLAIGDAQINSFLAARNVRIQFVEDYQAFDPDSTAWPTTIEGVLYPAGAFVKGTTDVIDLDTIYDSVGLSTNTYTAAFMEEGILVANRCGSGVAFAVDVCVSGQTGAADITCVVTP